MDLKLIEVMQEVNEELSLQDNLTTDIAQFTFVTPSLSLSKRDSLRTQLTNKFAILLEEKLSQRGFQEREFTYALTNLKPNEIFFGSPNFNSNSSAASTYSYPLTGRIKEKCHCQLILRLEVKNTFEYLLKKLQRLIIPSILFFLLLIACCIWLIRSINKQRKLAEIKNDFINNLTHELKTPVFSVSLATKMLEQYIKDLPSAKPKNYLQLIRAENEKMKGHIDAVLELASLESGKYIMDRSELRIDAFLKEITASYEIELDTNFTAENTLVSIDKTHFKNVIKNIIDNAKKYNDKEKLQIEIKTKIIDKHYFISIKDNGQGISKENQKHIFEKFYRVRAGDLHEVKGFGLGLSYAQQVVQAHGGSISVDSTLKESTTFTIKIPIK